MECLTINQRNWHVTIGLGALPQGDSRLVRGLVGEHGKNKNNLSLSRAHPNVIKQEFLVNDKSLQNFKS